MQVHEDAFEFEFGSPGWPEENSEPGPSTSQADNDEPLEPSSPFSDAFQSSRSIGKELKELIRNVHTILSALGLLYLMIVKPDKFRYMYGLVAVLLTGFLLVRWYLWHAGDQVEAIEIDGRAI